MATFDDRNDPNAQKLRKLYDKACKVAEDSAPCRWLYRNQSHEYFENIKKNDGGVMKMRLKDNGGDPDCPINDCLRGLFFMASVRSGSVSGEPLPMSPFGPYRLLVPAEDLLGNTKSNLYFADFYCMTDPRCHYVTLVATISGSEADDFCSTSLPSVDIWDNPFLFVTDGSLFVTSTYGLLVEVFYTEDLDISKYELRTNTPTIGNGHSTPGGIPKNEYCNVCNL